MRKYATYIPTHLNDGTAVDAAELEEILLTFVLRFGGITHDGPRYGKWVSDDGQIFEDEVIRLEIAIEESREAELKELIVAIGRRLEQEAMYFERTEAKVDILDLSEASENE